MEEQKSANSTYETWQPLVLAFTLSLGMLVGLSIQKHNSGFGLIQRVSESDLTTPGRVEEILRFIESKYVDDVDDDAVMENVIRSVFDELDPHSLYISPDRMGEVNDQMQGSYQGIGIETVFYMDTLIVTDVIHESPAEKADISKYDIILAVNDSLVSGKGRTYEWIKRELRGQRGDSLKISLQKKGHIESITRKIRIEDVPLTSADISFMVDDSIGYIKIKRFNAKVYREFMKSLEALAEIKSFKHLIIDVRQNPGGYLPETTNIISQMFKEKGLLIVYTQGKNNRMTTYRTTGKRFFDVGQIAVLTDEGSASGSEILAGAIQDWDRGIIVGRPTFGKGLVQEQYNLRNGGAIRLTVARYFTPSGRSIQRSYEDHFVYNHFIEERWNRGELSDEDSIRITDTTRYYTKRLNRTVYGGGGIFPDVFISMDSMVIDREYMQLSQFVPAFSYYLSRRSDLSFPDKFEDLSHRHFNQALILDLFDRHYSAETGLNLNILPVQILESIQIKIESALVKILYGELNSERWSAQYDAHIQEAAKQIRLSDPLADASAVR